MAPLFQVFSKAIGAGAIACEGDVKHAGARGHCNGDAHDGPTQEKSKGFGSRMVFPGASVVTLPSGQGQDLERARRRRPARAVAVGACARRGAAAINAPLCFLIGRAKEFVLCDITRRHCSESFPT